MKKAAAQARCFISDAESCHDRCALTDLAFCERALAFALKRLQAVAAFDFRTGDATRRARRLARTLRLERKNSRKRERVRPDITHFSTFNGHQGGNGYVAVQLKVWQSRFVRHRIFQRWFATLGTVAMFGALLSMPMTASYALAMAAAKSGPTAAVGQMPCHDKNCPDCPQKVCPDMGNCLVKCFQSLSAPAAEARLRGVVPSERVMPAPTRVTASSLTPPLLRPPSV